MSYCYLIAGFVFYWTDCGVFLFHGCTFIAFCWIYAYIHKHRTKTTNTTTVV